MLPLPQGDPPPDRCARRRPALLQCAYPHAAVPARAESRRGVAMKRGPLPKKAIDIAIPFALARGFLIFCRRTHGSVCDFNILSPGRTTLVAIARAKNLYGSLAEMAAELASTAADIRAMPPDPTRVFEIWACNYYKGIRFFRVERTGLVELDRDGKPFG